MAQWIPEEVVEMSRRQVVLGRAGSIKDITAQAVMFCQAESIAGQMLVIDGGMPGGMH